MTRKELADTIKWAVQNKVHVLRYVDDILTHTFLHNCHLLFTVMKSTLAPFGMTRLNL